MKIKIDYYILVLNIIIVNYIYIMSEELVNSNNTIYQLKNIMPSLNEKIIENYKKQKEYPIKGSA
jgi:hypothetical protein